MRKAVADSSPWYTSVYANKGYRKVQEQRRDRGPFDPARQCHR